MNVELIKHIVKSELTWKKQLYLIAIPVQLISLFLFWKLGVTNPIAQLSLMLSGALSFFSFLVPPSFLMVNNLNRLGQAGTFSWKYIHSIVHDRKNFILGCLVLRILFAIPTYVFLVILGILFNQVSLIVPLTPFYFLFSILLCLGFFLGILNSPKRLNYGYGGRSFLSMLREIWKRVQILVHVGLYFGSLLLFVSFAYQYSPIFGYFALVLSLVIICYSSYLRVLSTWADERNMYWDFSREKNKTFSYLIIFTVFLFSNDYHHGTIPGFESDIFDYIKENNLSELKKLKISKKDLLETNENGSTPLIKAVEVGNVDMVDYLLSKGANLEDKIINKGENDKYLEGVTPLMIALSRDDQPMMKILIKKGANVNAVNNEGMSAISYASAVCNPVGMEILVNSGANINLASKEGLTPLFYSARWRGCLSSILYLKKLGADEAIKNKNGMSFEEYIKANNPGFYRDYIFYMSKLK